MELTAMADWLNSTFAAYDYGILGALHMAAVYAGTVLTPLMKAITFIGEKGLLMFLISFVLMCFARTRRMGVCMFGAVCCGALITNLILKDMVARPRPFETLDIYRQWWQAVGSPVEEDFSFPSGHVTAITAGMTALCLSCRRRHKGLMRALALVAILLMALSRNYLMAHYPSDVLFAAAIGLFSALVAWGITLLIFRFLEDHDDLPFCAFVLDFDLRDLAGKLRDRPKKEKARPAPAGEPEDEDWDEPAEEPPRPAPAKPKAAPAKAKKTSPRGYQGKH